MKRKIKYSPEASDWLSTNIPIISNRIINKIIYFSKQENIFIYAKKLTSFNTYRFRIGNYRVIFRLNENILEILLIGKRDEIYK